MNWHKIGSSSTPARFTSLIMDKDLDLDLNSQMACYDGKPTAYLDHNILDIFVKYGALDFAEVLKSKFQIVYSDETLKEIKRSGNYSTQFLTVLRNLNGFHLKIVMDQPGFIVTDRATITDRDPFEAYDEYCNSEPEYRDVQKSMEQWLYKFCGGRVGEGIAEIHSEQKEAFRELLNRISSQVADIEWEQPIIEDMFKEYSGQMEVQLNFTLNETERLMKQNISDDKNWSGIKDFRKNINIGPKELNNIEPPNVLLQIWEKYRALAPYNEMAINIEDFFGVAKNPIYPDQPYFNHQKVTGIYNMLNTLGYFPDSKVHKERRFIASLSDTSHASMASFCNILISRDEYFVKKVKAAYEFLQIETYVQHVLF